MNKPVQGSVSFNKSGIIGALQALILLFVFSMANPLSAQISLGMLGVVYNQDFNTLANTGTSSTLPAGWVMAETGAGANTLYTANAGTSNTGDTYSYGIGTSTERSLGGIQSANVNPLFGASFTNNTGFMVTALNIGYLGEQWRLGALARVDRLDFQYSTDATSLTTGTWNDVNALDFTAPITGPTVGALPGNTIALPIISTITGLSIPNGATFWIRWQDFNATGADDGLAVDTFSLMPLNGAEIDVLGNSISIVDGDATPSLTDHTDFGTNEICSGTLTRTFTIVNAGTATLNISGITISGPDAADFTVVTPPASTVAAGGGTTTFTVEFSTSTLGLKSATITVNNDDLDEGTYDFAIQATGGPDVTAPNIAPGPFTTLGPVPIVGSGNFFAAMPVSGLPVPFYGSMITSMCIDVTYPTVEDLVVAIADQTTVGFELFALPGSLVGANLTGTCIDQVSPTPITSSSAPYTGTFADGTFGAPGFVAFDGIDPNNTWIVGVQNVGVNNGIVNSGSLVVNQFADITTTCSHTQLSPPTMIDNCAGSVSGTAIIGGIPQTIPFTINTIGTTVITWSFDDGNGNVSTFNQNVIINDITPPTIICPSDAVVSADPGVCTATTPSIGTPIASDDCGTPTVTNNAPSPFPMGSTTVTWTATDGAGNTATCTQLVIVVDIEPPVMSCPSNVNVNVDAGTCTAVVNGIGPVGTSDNCSIASINYTTFGATSLSGANDASGSTFNVGTTFVGYVISDGAGNTTTCSFSVTVTDNILPTIGCPSDVNVNVDPGLCTASAVGLGVPTTSDNCSIASTTNDAPGVFPVGTTIVTWTTTDVNGNTATCTQNVVVTDNINPTVTCQNITVNPSSGSPVTVLPHMLIVSASDNCALFDTTLSTNVFTCAEDGMVIPVTVTVFDVNGNSSNCIANVTVTGVGCSANNPPVAICQDVTVNADGSCQGTAVATDFNNGSFDPDSDPLTFSVLPTGPYPLGNTIVTLTVSDGSLSSTCTATITVEDNTAPNIAPGPFTTLGPVPIVGSGNFFAAMPVSGLPVPFYGSMITSMCIDVTYPTVEDLVVAIADQTTVGFELFALPGSLVGANLTGTCIDQVSPTPITSSSAPYTGTFADGTFGAPGFVAFDGIDPNNTWIVGVQNVGVNNGIVNSGSLVVNQFADITTTCSHTQLSPPTMIDNCAGSVSGTAIIGGIPQTIPFTINTIGTTVITWSFDDGNGNVSTFNQNVIINDITPPTIICPSDAVVSADPGVCTATTPSIGTPIASDDCGTPTVTNNAPSPFPMGSTTVTWTATDGAGNTATCTQLVIVVDIEPPVMSCPSNVNVNVDAGTCTAVVNGIGPVGTSDNCSIASINYTTFGATSLSGANDASGSTFNVGTTFVGYVISDGAGNTTTCSFSVTVTDNILPTIGCPSDVNVNVDPGLCTASAVGLGVPTTSDNCSIASTTNDAPGVFPVGTTIVTWTTTDVNGNTATCTQNVVVTDNINPTVTCQNITVNPSSGSPVTVLPHMLIVSASDNCALFDTTLSTNVFTCAEDGMVIPVTVTVFDVNGNSSNCIANVTVTGVGCSANNPPVAICQDVTVNADGSCQGTAVATDFNNGSFDPDSDPLTFSVLPTGPYPLGNTIVTLTVSDGSLSSTCTATITVEDNTAPNIAPGPFTTLGPVPIVGSGNFFAAMPVSGLPVPFYGSMITSMCIDVTYPTVEDLVVAIADQTTVGFELFALPGSLVGANLTGTCIDQVSPTPITSSSAPYTGTFADGTFGAPGFVAFDGIDPNNTWIVGVQNVGVNNGIVNSGSLVVNQFADITTTCSHTQLSPPTMIDNCAGSVSGTAIIGGIPQTIPFTINTIGTTVITWSFDDGNGNVSTFNQNVIINDITPPTIICPSDAVVSADPGVCTATTPSIGTPIASDDCGTPTVTNNAPSPFPLGSTTVTWTATDGAGNTATCTQLVIVVDIEPPVMSCPSNVNVNVDAGTCTAVVNGIGPVGTSDNCSIASINYTTFGATSLSGANDASGSTFNVGTTFVGYVISDGAGNTTTCSFSVTVTDNILPTIGCPSDVNVNVDPGLCTASAVGLGVPTTSDNCSIASTTNDAPGVFPVGTTIVTWTTTDVNGNTATCTQNVVVTDNINPTVTCQNITVNPSSGSPVTVLPHMLIVSASDNCALFDTTLSTNVFTCAEDGMVIPVTVTVFDVNGNSSNCIANVTVTGVGCSANNPPVAICQDVTVNADGSCQGTAVATDFNNGSFDPDSDPLTFSVLPTGPYPLGNTIVTLTVSDGSLSSTCTATITVNDVTAPVISCPADANVNTNAGCTYVGAIGTATATDNCTALPTIINDAPASFPLGATTVTWTATDGAGNTATCTQLVTVTDVEVPVISCPADANVNTNTGCTYVGAIGTATATDNCTALPTITNDAPASFPLGATTVTWTATDGAGNTATCTQLVTVTDVEVPAISCPADANVNTNTGCTYVGAIGTATATDNCTALPTITNDAPVSFPLGATTVTWTATDGAGNTATCTQLVTVTDVEVPVISCPANANVNTNTGCTYVGAIGTATATDNCTALPTITNDAPASFPLGATTVTWTATDGAGNTATCTQLVTVTDVEVPVISCPADANVNTNTGCTYVGAIGTATATDNCTALPTITNDAPASFPLGATTVTWTATDGAGNTATCTQLVTVTDVEVPVISCPADANVNTNTGCTYVGAIGTATATDNCTALPTITNDAPASFPLGATTVTWTATDGAGNTATCTQLVTVTDVEVPVISCPLDVNVNVDAGLCTASGVVLGSATATDNCTALPTITNDAPGIFPVGGTTVTWTATDVAGNTATCTQLVTVTDNINPLVSCQDIVVNPTPGFPVTVLPHLLIVSASDNCAIMDTTLSSNVFSCAQDGMVIPVTVTVIDVNGNSSNCIANVTVTGIGCNPNNPPVAICQDVTVNADASCQGSAVAADFNNGSFDPDLDPLTFSILPTGPYTLGNTIVTLTVSDGSLSSTCTATITVQDVTVPVITCPADANLNTNTGCTYVGAIGTATATDNCTASPLITNDAPGTFPLGATIVTWMATDGAGNTATCTQVVTIIDAEVPVITCPADLNLNTNTGCTYVGAIGTATATDNCTALPTITNDAPASFPLGATTVTWTATDGAGNTATCTQLVTVTDVEVPVISCPADANVNTNTGCTYVGAIGTATATDNCTATPTITNDAPGAFGLGTTIVTWTATDGAGNTATCTQSVTVTDIEVPVITCPADVNLNTNTGCTYVGTIGTATATDNCAASPLITNDAPVAFGLGTTIVTWTATDGAGNSSTCTQSVTVTDIEVPTILCPVDVNVSTDLGTCVATGVALGTPTTNDNCGVASVTNDGLVAYGIGSTTVTWTVTDVNGNTTTCTQLVTVTDNELPTISCPADVNTIADLGLCSASGVALGLPGTADNCGIAGTSNDAPVSFPVGNTTVTWTVTDVNGNTATCTQLVTVADMESPTVTCQDVTVNPSSGSPVTLLPGMVVLSAGDNCAMLDTTVTPNIFTCLQDGMIIPVTVTVFDVNGNSSGCVANVTVTGVGCLPNNAPVAICQDITVNANGSCEGTAIATDFDNGSFDPDLDPISFSVLPAGPYALGNTVVTLTVTDGMLSSTCTATITVQDVTAPTILCPADVSVSTDLGTCVATGVTLGAPTVNDNCGVALVTNDAPVTFLLGNTTVTWTVTDNAGLTATCTQLVTVTDTEIPTVLCPTDVNVSTDLGTCTATGIALGTPTIGDNCGVASTINDAPGTFLLGTTTVTWTVTDVNGNTNTCTQLVTVTDTELPTILCPTDVTVANDLGTCTATGVALGTPTTNDNCGVATTTNDAPVTFGIGTTTVTWTVTDVNGNTATCTQLVTVTDTEVPVITCPADVNLNTNTGCTYVGAIGTATATDNCTASPVITNDAPAAFGLGTTIVTWMATDGAGNTATCTQSVTITDIELPTILCPADVNASTDPGVCAATGVALGIPTTADNCGVASVTNDAPVTFLLGSTTVTWTVTDVNGNTNTCTQLVTITDNELPSIICPSDVIVSSDPGVCTASGVTLGAPTTSDNCGVAGSTNDGLLVYPIGTTVVTWTVTDVNGNTNTCTQNVTVVDMVAPVANCQDITVAVDSTGLVTILPSQIDNGSTDNCGIASMTVSPATFNCSNLGVVTVTLTVTDNSGNTATCTSNVTIIDTLAPVFTVPANINTVADLGVCYATGINIGLPVYSDNCAVAIITNDAPLIYPVGVTVITWTLTDFQGNSSTATQTVTVVDDQLPIVNCQNLTVSLDGTGNATVTAAMVDNGSTDNCGIATMVVAPSSFSCADLGPNIVTLTVTDIHGNTATCTSTVTIIDDISPSITCPADVITSNDPGLCSASGIALGAPVVSDNCGSLVVTNNAPATFPVGVTNVIWTVTDLGGNTTTCVQQVTVVDDELPVITGMPSNITAGNLSGTCFAIVTWSAPSASDNCGISSFTSSHPSGGVFPVGTTIVVYTATDLSGNTSTATFSVTVNDVEAPAIFNMPSNITVNADPGVCSADVAWSPLPFAMDNCSSVLLTSTHASGSTFSVGTTTVVYTATDGVGNTTTASFTVTVIDNQNPVVTVTSPITVNSTPGLCSFAGAIPPAVTSDNCGILSVVNNASSPMPVGANTVTWTVTDVNGNITTVTQTINVVDAEAPVMIAPGPVNAVVNTSPCGATGVSLGVPIFNDNCGIASVSNNALSVYPVGVTVVTWTATDVHGNTSTATQTVTVAPPTPLVIGVLASPNDSVCEGTMVTLNGTGASTYNWTGGIQNGIPFMATATTTYTVTATGTFGCTATATFTLTVNPAPVVSYVVSPNDTVCPNSTVTLNGTGASTYTWTGGVVDGVGFMVPGTSSYTVTGTDVNGCSATATANIVVVGTDLGYIAFPNDTVCEGTEITLSGTGGSGYVWTSGIQDGVPFTPTFSYSTVLTATDTVYGCVTSIIVDIVVNYNPVVDLGPDITVMDFAVLDAGNVGSTYLWNDNSLLTTQIIYPNTSGTYYVEVTDANGCLGTDTINVTVQYAGLEEMETAIIQLYPNPNEGYFNISINNLISDNVTAEIFDEKGSVVHLQNIGPVDGNTIVPFNVPDLRVGPYYVRLNANGQSVILKFIKNK